MCVCVCVNEAPALRKHSAFSPRVINFKLRKAFKLEGFGLQRLQRKDIIIGFILAPLKTNPNLSPFQFPISMDCTDLVPPKPSRPAKAPTLPKSAARKEMPPVAVSAGQTLIISLTLSLPEGAKLTEEAPSCWALSAEGES